MTTEIAKAIAKTAAYLKCGKQAEAEKWFIQLAQLLQLSHMLK